MGILVRQGYELTSRADEAEVLVVNTCSFIEPAQKESVDAILEMAEHKKVGGLVLPHKLTFSTENEVSEEFEISKYQINPQFKSDLFEKH